MADVLLFTMAVLLPSALALTTSELSLMSARVHIEQNTNAQGTVSVSTSAIYYTVTSNSIPDHSTGTFPSSDNPNNIAAQSLSFRIAVTPSIAATATCMPMGPLAFSKNGVALFSPVTFQGNNAVEGEYAEVFDSCDGHPDGTGTYHYHQTPDCLYNGTNDEFVGVALDGFPIYGIKDANGVELTSADLDECHGEVVNGTSYRYRLTRDYPYIMGCFKGTPSPDISSRKFTASNCIFANGSCPMGSFSLAMLVLVSIIVNSVTHLNVQS